jgi:pilus assembly protein CpaB
MRRGRILIFVVLILIIGLVVAAVAIRQFLLQANQPQAPAFVDVYIASQTIPQGEDITESVLATVSLPPDKVAAVMFTREELPALTTNKVAKYPLDAGVFITESMISDKSAAVSIAGPQWASIIPTGMTAVSIPTNRLSTVGYGVADGAHVNVNACFLFVDIDPAFQTILPNLTAVLTGTGFTPDALPVLSLGVGAAGSPQGRLELEPSVQQPYYLIPSEAQRPRMVCQMLLQNVVVMKLGNFPLPGTAEAQPAADPNAQAAPPPSTDLITLIVSPQDSITLSYLVLTNAQIMMTLRNPGDDGRQATEASTLQFLLSQYNIPVPAKLPYSMQPAITTLAPPIPNTTTVTP